MRRFILLFALVLGVGFIGQLTPPVQQYVVVPFTHGLAQVCAALMQLLEPTIIAVDKALIDGQTGRGVVVEAGCNGIEACLILVAAILAYPAPWRLRAAGLLAGVLAIQAVNVVRIVSLYYLFLWDEAVFRFAHLYVWQSLIMLDAVVVWLLWLRWTARREMRAAAA